MKYMDELVKLMDELSLALKVRLDTSNKVVALANEVRNVPKLSVIAPHLAAAGTNTENDAQVLEHLQLRMELQNLQHVKEEALETITQAIAAVAQIRTAVNAYQGSVDRKIEQIIDEYGLRIQTEKIAYADIEQRRQDILFRLNEKKNLLERIT